VIRLPRPEAGTTVFSPNAEIVGDVAIDRGTVVFVAHDDATDTGEVLASRRTGAGWSAPALLGAAGAGVDLAGPDVATDAAGDALATWTADHGLAARSVAASAFQASRRAARRMRVSAGPHTLAAAVVAGNRTACPRATRSRPCPTWSTCSRRS